MFKRAAAVAICSVAALVLTACSPATIGYVAIHRSGDGLVSAVVVMCVDGVGLLRLTRAGGTAAPGARPSSGSINQKSWEFEPTLPGTSEIVLSGAETFISSGRYSLQGAGEKKYGVVTHSWDGNVQGPESFTSDDLNGLAANEVLGLDPQTLEPRAFDRDEFESNACR